MLQLTQSAKEKLHASLSQSEVILALPEVLQPLFEDKSLDIDDGGNLTVS
jgi:hypothetical protein